jgi:hypothetical protein
VLKNHNQGLYKKAIILGFPSQMDNNQDIRYNLLNAWNSRRTKTKVWTLCPFLELGTKHPWKELQSPALLKEHTDYGSVNGGIFKSPIPCASLYIWMVYKHPLCFTQPILPGLKVASESESRHCPANLGSVWGLEKALFRWYIQDTLSFSPSCLTESPEPWWCWNMLCPWAE